ncbi:MAG TPA: Arc family DNA-binding protein [Caulobacteraceae bacterium]|jgi:plasmid stability protein
MAVNLSIKNAPEHIVESLRRRAERNHRSLQGELMAIIEAAAREGPLTVEEARARIRALGLKSPSEAAAMIRADRDGR